MTLAVRGHSITSTPSHRCRPWALEALGAATANVPEAAWPPMFPRHHGLVATANAMMPGSSMRPSDLGASAPGSSHRQGTVACMATSSPRSLGTKSKKRASRVDKLVARSPSWRGLTFRFGALVPWSLGHREDRGAKGGEAVELPMRLGRWRTSGPSDPRRSDHLRRRGGSIDWVASSIREGERHRVDESI